jgi:nitroimidazol reductase NimA-like FMN-containing flavoprotein (pyridoxamine 5'-phosphate oxidase superfamily)
MSELSMSREQCEAFLAEAHVGVLCLSRPDGRAPLASPVWYVVAESGELLVSIGASSEKARLLGSVDSATLCVSDESLPYRFVTVSGPVRIGPGDDEIRRTIAARYLPPAMVEGYLASGSIAEMRTLAITPRHVYSNDFSKYA